MRDRDEEEAEDDVPEQTERRTRQTRPPDLRGEHSHQVGLAPQRPNSTHKRSTKPTVTQMADVLLFLSECGFFCESYPKNTALRFFATLGGSYALCSHWLLTAVAVVAGGGAYAAISAPDAGVDWRSGRRAAHAQTEAHQGRQLALRRRHTA